MPRLSAIEVYKLLPHKNCGACKESSCMSMALRLINREKTPFQCPHLTETERHALIQLLIPPVREIKFGAGERQAVIGGEEVMYRHELKFFNPCVFSFEISDEMDEREVGKRIKFVREFEIERVGQKLRVDAIAVKSSSNNPEKFKQVVMKVAEKFDGPLILCSFNPEILEKGISVVKERKPLLYAANSKNWKEMAELAKKNHLPLAVFSNDIAELASLARQINYDKLVLDPGVYPVGDDLVKTLNNFTQLRKSAVKGMKELGYPLMAAPAVVWVDENDVITASYYEAFIASVLLDRFASLLILHTTEPWAVLPILTLRQNIYTDPRTEPKVEPGLYKFGNPNENSPVLVTTNFSLTFFTVSGDINKANVSCFLIVVDSKGFAVDTAVATGDFSASKVKDAISKHEVEKKVKHKTLIIPQLAAKLRGPIEEETGWKVIIGPRDSSQIPSFLRDNWKGG